ncbi:DUF4386 domain-containing protein [Colwellia piezophila]|uniref:DUF4386 domain-containing protein n=1 Tax=Colwellia piezophila TaxID=211668 RepID=UPI00035D36BA|nr:DUF4386 domain-containing protein [Colwellia piezophila]
MTNTSSNVKNNYTKIAGITYALIIVLSLIPSAIFDFGSLLKAKNAADNIIGQEGIIGLSIAIEFLMFILVMVLSWALYIILKPVNKSIALFGLMFRFSEAVLGCVVIMFYLAILMLLSGADYLQAFQPEQLQALARFFGKLGGVGYYLLLVTMGIGAIAYCYLFYISRYIPRVLAAWGIFTYATMVAYGFINIIVHNPPSELAYAMAPGALFEVTIGLWLAFKGISVKQSQTASIE